MRTCLVAALVLIGLAGCADDDPPDWLVDLDSTTTTTAAPATTDTTAPVDGSTTTTAVDAQTPVTELVAGDCVVGDAFGGAQPEATQAEIVDCATPHDAEVVGLVTYAQGPEETYPGQEQVAAFAEDNCAGTFESYVGIAYGDSALKLLTLWPTEDSWATGDREAVCLAFDEAGPLTATVAGTAQ